jgi:hypothetical protein
LKQAIKKNELFADTIVGAEDQNGSLMDEESGPTKMRDYKAKTD